MKALGVLLLAIPCFVIAQGTNIPLFFNLFYVLLALLVLAYAWAWANLQGLQVDLLSGFRVRNPGSRQGYRICPRCSLSGRCLGETYSSIP